MRLTAALAAAVLSALLPSHLHATPDPYYAGVVARYAAAYGVPGYTDWIVATIECETGGTWDPYSQNRVNGAWGLAQFLPHGGAWDSGIYAAYSVSATSPEQQIEAMVELWSRGWFWIAQWDCSG